MVVGWRRRREVEGGRARGGPDARGAPGQGRMLFMRVGVEGKIRRLVGGSARQDLHAGRASVRSDRATG